MISKILPTAALAAAAFLVSASVGIAGDCDALMKNVERTIDKVDPIGNRQGAPGLFIDAQFGATLDNFSITQN